MPEKRNSRVPVVAVDIGGTKILTVLFSAGGKILAEDTRPTLAAEGVEAVIARLCDAISAVIQEAHSTVGGIGIACAGGIDTLHGVVVTPSPHLPGWVDIPLARILRGKFALPVYILNDASAAALGEHRFGAGKGVRDLVLLTLGTGIGGGIIADGRLYLGGAGGAGGLGHMNIDVKGADCPRGNKRCLEMLASGTAVAREAVKMIQQGRDSALIQMAEGKIDKVTAEMVGQAARKGDGLSLQVISQAAYYLGVGMVNIANIFNPELIVLGGGMAEMSDLLMGPGRRMVDERAFTIAARAVRIVTAGLGNEAGVYGAAAYTLEKVRRSYEST
jgi:glucokinase